MVDIMSFISNRHGKYYASFVADNGDADSALVAIMGPFDLERQAEYWSSKWVRLNQRRLKKGEHVALPDVTTVPADVRLYITESLRAALRQDRTEALSGKVFGRALN